MIKEQEQHCDPSPVFGKPWFWQRGTMESTRSLAQVILEMQDEIKKLEAENQELRGGWAQRSCGAKAGMLENPYLNLRRNTSAPILERQYKEPTIMTVRRYSTSPNMSGVTMREGVTDRGRRGHSGWGRLQHEIQHGFSVFSSSVIEEVGKVTNRNSLQEYVQRNMAKVKTVTFLLPVDDIYTSRPTLTKHHEEPQITSLTSIEEIHSCVKHS